MARPTTETPISSGLSSLDSTAVEVKVMVSCK